MFAFQVKDLKGKGDEKSCGRSFWEEEQVTTLTQDFGHLQEHATRLCRHKYHSLLPRLLMHYNQTSFQCSFITSNPKFSVD